MKNSPVFAAMIVFVFFACASSSEKIRAVEELPAPCDTMSPAPCSAMCQMHTSGNYLCDKSIFDSPLFENRLIGKKSKSKISFYGWMLTGITVNNHGATQTYGPDGSVYGYNNRYDSQGNIIRPGMNDRSGNTYALMIEQPTDWKVNQLWLGAKKDLDHHWGWGFQSDFVYGTDLRYARNWGDQSFDYQWGSGDYFASFAQLFATVGTKDLFVKVGKFAGGFSYEGLAATREYFYTHANIAYGRPLTTHGAMVEWHPHTKWTFTGGWTAGVFNSFENPYNDHGFLGKITYNVTTNTSLTYKFYYNDRGERPGINTGQIDCLNTVIFTWKINKDWFYMGEIATTNNKVYGNRSGDAWGINNYLIRTLSDKLSVGLRGEFHHSRNSTFDNANITGGQGGDLWNVTMAAHYKITPKTTFRPEIRYDFADYRNGYRPFGGDESKNDQLCGGVSCIVVF